MKSFRICLPPPPFFWLAVELADWLDYRIIQTTLCAQETVVKYIKKIWSKTQINEMVFLMAVSELG